MNCFRCNQESADGQLYVNTTRQSGNNVIVAPLCFPCFQSEFTSEAESDRPQEPEPVVEPQGEREHYGAIAPTLEDET